MEIGERGFRVLSCVSIADELDHVLEAFFSKRAMLICAEIHVCCDQIVLSQGLDRESLTLKQTGHGWHLVPDSSLRETYRRDYNVNG